MVSGLLHGSQFEGTEEPLSDNRRIVGMWREKVVVRVSDHLICQVGLGRIIFPNTNRRKSFRVYEK